MSKPIRICGLGTGRCGTKSLATLLSRQPGAAVSHEAHPPLSWCADPDPARHFRGFDGAALRADVGFYYLPWVDALRSEFPELRFVCLRRNRAAVIASFERKRPLHSHWFREGPPDNVWDRCFPSYEPPLEFAEAVGRYWDEYYAAAETFVDDRFRIVATETLNTIDGVAELLEFCGVAEPVLETGIRITH